MECMGDMYIVASQWEVCGLNLNIASPQDVLNMSSAIHIANIQIRHTFDSRLVNQSNIKIDKRIIGCCEQWILLFIFRREKKLLQPRPEWDYVPNS